MGLLGLLKRPLRSRCRIGIYSVAEYRLRIFGLDMEVYRKVLIRIMRMRDSRRLRVFILLIWWLCKNLSPSFFPPSQFFFNSNTLTHPQAMVQSPRPPHSSSQHLPTSPRLQQTNTKSIHLPRYPVRISHGDLLALYPPVAECIGH